MLAGGMLSNVALLELATELARAPCPLVVSGGGCIGVVDALLGLVRFAGCGVDSARAAADAGVTGMPDPGRVVCPLGGCSWREVLLRGGIF